MTSGKLISSIFYASAGLHCIFGIALLFCAKALYRLCKVPSVPEQWVYVQLLSAVIITFGVIYLQIARDPQKNRHSIPYGILFNLFCSGIIFYNWLMHASIPRAWKPFAFIDVVLALVFVWAYFQIPKVFAIVKEFRDFPKLEAAHK